MMVVERAGLGRESLLLGSSFVVGDVRSSKIRFYIYSPSPKISTFDVLV